MPFNKRISDALQKEKSPEGPTSGKEDRAFVLNMDAESFRAFSAASLDVGVFLRKDLIGFQFFRVR
jgi:hypothetical protein